MSGALRFRPAVNVTSHSELPSPLATCRRDGFLIRQSGISFYLFLTPAALNRAMLLPALGAAFQGSAQTGEDRYVQWYPLRSRPRDSSWDLAPAPGHSSGSDTYCRAIAGADWWMANTFARRATHWNLIGRGAAIQQDSLARASRS